MKNNTLLKRLALFVFVITAISLFSIRNNAITPFCWKHTSGGNVGTDVFYFSEDSQCCYNCPLIKKNEKIIGIALFQLNGRLMVYSVYDTSLAFFMAI